jgi:hypothetical protein
LKIRGDILEWMFITGVTTPAISFSPVSTKPAIRYRRCHPCHGFSVIAGVVVTGNKFITGDNDTGDKFIAGDNNVGD